MHYLDTLNDQQKKAVLATEGPVLIVAGAGAGKTKTITHRILHLMHTGVPAEQILAITFTNKAAREMRDRVRDLLAHDPDLQHTIRTMPFISTFHSLGVLIIKENAELLRLPRHFTIFDTADSKKVLKDALVYLGIDPKEHLDSIRHIISHEKGRGVTCSEYQTTEAYSYTSEITKKAWTRYEETLTKEHALDFDDLLLKTLKLLQNHKDVLGRYQRRFKYIHIDEYQDTNKVQNTITDLIAERHHNICIVGDTDQCLTKGTRITLENGGTKEIEKIKPGDMVLSNFGSGDFRGSKVMSVHTHQTNNELILIETLNGNLIGSTPDHVHFAGYRLGTTPQLHMNYLMYKKGFGWRIGTTSVHTKGQVKPVPGFQQRSNQEHADACWIIATHATQQEARIQEYIFSLKYQIPTLPFTARKGNSMNGYTHDKIALEKIFSYFETEKSAERLLSDLGFSKNHPHHRPQTRNTRKNINVTLCADRRGKTPMHLISTFGNSEEDKKKLQKMGFSVRFAKKNGKNWRFETVLSDYGEACVLATKIASMFEDSLIVFEARLGGIKLNTKDGNSLQCLPASCVMPGMSMFTQNGYDIVKKVSKISASKNKVYDLDVEKTHNFVANNIVTHNCIYSWRGAEIKHMLHFEKTYPGVQTIFLEQNYRSTKTILAVANEIIQKNTFRIAKNLFTENMDGELLSLFAGRDETDEAHFIAMTAGRLIAEGTPADRIAVLYRANFQSRVLEEAFLAYGVPYQLLGTKFFERKEIKDMLSYVKAALSPESTTDFVRIINTPARGIGKATLEKILAEHEEMLPDGTRAKIQAVRDMLEVFRVKLMTEKISDALKYIITHSGMEKLYENGTEEDTDRLENIMELVTLARQYDEYPPEEGVEKFLTESALASDQDTLDQPKTGVKLMTVHSSKGLEFDTVFVSGLEADLFPHKGFGQDRKSKEENEEERRLFYVALTRAEKKLFLTYADTRTIFGNTEVTMPSEFISDIPAKYIVQETYGGEKMKEPLFSINF